MDAFAQSPLATTDPTPFGGQTILVMVIAIGVLAALSWVLRRGTRLRRPGQMIAVETAVPLGERRSLIVVAVEGRRLLLGMTPGQISLVTELQPPFSATLDQTVGQPDRTEARS